MMMIYNTTTRQRRRTPSHCKICSGTALYSYFGVISCSSCKMFFRRHAEQRQKILVCRYGGHCTINRNNRHLCLSCRLKKCFACGMQVELFRGTINKRRQTSKAGPTSQQLKTLNLLRSDQSRLSLDQWTHLSNIIHFYDKYSEYSLAQTYMEEQNRLPFKLRYKYASIHDIMTKITSAGQRLFEKNLDFLSLTKSDQAWLFQRTIKQVAGLNSCFITHAAKLMTTPGCYQSMASVYGCETLNRGNLAVARLDFDFIATKLILSALVFFNFDYVGYCGDNYQVNTNDIKMILRIQNQYIDLIWRYLLYRYDETYAVRCFSHLVLSLLALIEALVHAVEVKHYNEIIDSIVNDTKKMSL